MRKRSAAFTTTELIVVISIVVVLGAVIAVLAIMLSRPSRTSSSSATRTPSSTRGASLFRIDTERRRAVCKSNLGQIGKALAYYESDYRCFPYASWDTPNPSSSLSLLYPEYTSINVNLFKCPSTEDTPEINITVLAGGNMSRMSTFGAYPKQPSYGYDHRTNPRKCASDHAICADMDGSAIDPYSQTSNHRNGQNVLYLDGHVGWRMTNYASNNCEDNIYTADGTWGVDTDSIIKVTAND